MTIRNSKFASGILFNGDNVRLENNDIVDGISLSGTATAVIDRNEIRDYGADGMHITSDSGQVSNVTVTNNFIRSPIPEPGAHADGVQVRGVNGLTFTNNAIDMGVWKQVAGQDALNAAIFLEDANGGNSNITLNGNYLNGGGYILRIGVGPNQQYINNRFGPDGRYGVVHNIAKPGNITVNSGNVMDLTNQPVTF
ncbi:MAG TPA: right-handed parallel beta-helix repeat-containing protein [Candidatus Saccharimonadales bacterium]|nr:right-handed parallel beta-helix repeat-containing protein [Candidatus Saccharimonadales bacterium]